MCSIAGVSEGHNQKIINSMLQIMSHRAPDDKGVYSDNEATIGMGRLKILDLFSENLCPYIDENLVLSFNGEIYNYKDIKSELKNLGFKFKTNSDTEVLAQAWHKWGTKIFSKLNGMFAFAIYDKKNKRFI